MRKTKVAFVAHPLNISTLSIISGWPKSILTTVGLNRVRKYLEHKEPFIFNRMNDLRSISGSTIDLMGIACPLLPDQMVTLASKIVINKVVQAAKLAKKNGADIVVLGGFTSVIGNEGEDVAASVDLAVTSGNTFTAGLAIHGVEKAMNLLGIARSKKCAIIGATGDIGGACADYFADRTDHLACVGRDEVKLVALTEKYRGQFSSTYTWHKKVADAVRGADVIISATSALTTLIDSDMLSAGAIVCDVALPANIAKEVARKRKDVFVFEGGLSKVPFHNQVNNSKWKNLMPNNAIYGCLAEGLVLGFENLLENFSIGRGKITSHKIQLIMDIAHKHGLGLSDYFCGEKFYSSSELDFIAQAADKSKKYSALEKVGTNDRN